MKKRELIILVLAVLACVYGLLDYFVFSGKEMDNQDEKIALQNERINTFVDSAGMNLTVLTSKNDFQNMVYLISRAESEWTNDPFWVYPDDDIKPDDPQMSNEIPDLSYTGFVKAGKKALAVINGMEYTLGELLKDTGYKIYRITPSRVILLTDAKKEIILELQEN